MLGRFFGVRRARPQEAAVPAPRPQAMRLPWAPEGNVAASVAMGFQKRMLMDSLMDGRGIHVETMMTALGALAGFSAQHAIRETYVRTGRLPLHGGADRDAGAFVVATAGNPPGVFFFGDLLNSFLVPAAGRHAGLGPGPFTLHALVGVAVAEAGGAPLALDEVGPIFGHAASMVGDVRFGDHRLDPRHRPRMTSMQALRRFWPDTLQIMGRSPPHDPSIAPLPPIHWPVAMGIIAQEMIRQTKDALPPALSMRLIFEAAIPMSKVDPAEVITRH